MTNPSAYELMYPCQIFQWIGQRFDTCDGCGRPYWKHMYNPPYGGAKPLFRIRQGDRSSWVWRPVGSIITAAEADAMRDKWGGL